MNAHLARVRVARGVQVATKPLLAHELGTHHDDQRDRARGCGCPPPRDGISSASCRGPGPFERGLRSTSDVDSWSRAAVIQPELSTDRLTFRWVFSEAPISRVGSSRSADLRLRVRLERLQQLDAARRVALSKLV